jgi:hypothetical protein
MSNFIDERALSVVKITGLLQSGATTIFEFGRITLNPAEMVVWFSD